MAKFGIVKRTPYEHARIMRGRGPSYYCAKKLQPEERYTRMRSDVSDDTNEQVEAMRDWIEFNPLRIWRQEKGVSMRMAASMMDKNLHTIQSWEHGIAWPSDSSMEDIIEVTKDDNMAHKWIQWHSRKP